MKKFKLLYHTAIIFFFIALPFFALAQEITLKGVVKDIIGNPLLGASITVKGNNTLADGSFSLQLPSSFVVLEVTNVGFKSQTAEFTGLKSIFIYLAEGFLGILKGCVIFLIVSDCLQSIIIICKPALGFHRIGMGDSLSRISIGPRSH